jgi:tight adherence protein B
MGYVITGLAFGTGFLLILAANFVLVDLLAIQRQQTRKRLEEELRLQQHERTRKAIERGDLYVLASEEWAELVARPTLRERFIRLAEESGLRIQPGQLLGLSVSLAVLMALPAAMLTGKPLAVLPAALVGGLLPLAYVAFVRARRREKLLSQLPDAFDLMSRLLRAGQTIPQGLQAVADEFPSPIADEFRCCYDQQNLGLSPEAAMRDLARRTGLLELKIFVLAILVHHQTGGNLVELLDKLSKVIRDRYRTRGAIKAATAEGRMQAIILLALPPLMLLIMFLLNRPYMMVLLEHPMLLVGMFVSMCIGGFWMHRIVSFDF